MEKYITIIGSRSVTENEFSTLQSIASYFQGLGYTLRSGGAKGSDSSIHHLQRIEIYIPWNGFSNFWHNGRTVFCLNKLPDQVLAETKAKEIHPAPENLTEGALKLHTRNIYQIIGFNGANGVKSDIVVYCADDDAEGLPIGGTRTAVSFAKKLNIPVYNIRDVRSNIDSDKELLSELLSRIKRGESDNE